MQTTAARPANRTGKATLAFRRALAAVLAVAAVTAVGGATAATPPGQGLGEFPVMVECEGYGLTAVTTAGGSGPPASGPGWLAVSGQLTLVRSVTISVGGQVVFERSYGKKAGLGPAFTCTGTLPDGAVFSAEVVAVP
jgi:hypothetical protein